MAWVSKKRLIKVFLILLFDFIYSDFYAQDISNLNSEKPITAHGALNLEMNAYSATGIENRKKPFSIFCLVARCYHFTEFKLLFHLHSANKKEVFSNHLINLD